MMTFLQLTFELNTLASKEFDNFFKVQTFFEFTFGFISNFGIQNSLQIHNDLLLLFDLAFVVVNNPVGLNKLHLNLFKPTIILSQLVYLLVF